MQNVGSSYLPKVYECCLALLGGCRGRGCGHVGYIFGDKEASDAVSRHSFVRQTANVLSREHRHGFLDTGCRWDGGTALTGNDSCGVGKGKAEVLADRARHRCGGMSFGRTVVALRDAEEARRGAVTPTAFVFVAPWTVEMV